MATTVSAATLEQVEAACRAGTFDLALLGWGLRPLAKLAAAEILRRFFPGITILDLCRGRSAIPGAEACNVQDPSDLLAAIALKLRDRKSRGSHPRRRLSLDRAAREEPS